MKWWNPMSKSRIQVNAQALRAGSPVFHAAQVSPDPNGNRAQRRAWRKMAKRSDVKGDARGE